MTKSIFADRVHETSTTSGTGNLTLAGAVANCVSFNTAFGLNVLFDYCITDSVAGLWETGQGYLSASTTLVRSVVYSNSSGTTSFISFSSNSKDVFVDITASFLNNVPWSPGSINGLRLSYGGTISASVAAGYAIDVSNQVNMTLAAGTTVSPSLGGASGSDGFAGPGTATVGGGSQSVTGTSTTFLTSFGLRTLTGTITSGGTAVTGMGTKFTSQVFPGDLIGTASLGYYQVTAIASDTSLTLVTTPGTNFSGQTPNCVENASIAIVPNAAVDVTTITSNTALTVLTPQTAQTSVAYDIGVPAPSSISYVFLATGSSGTAVYASTQRTTPFGITGYTTAFRRIGQLSLDASSNIIPFSQSGEGNTRLYQFGLATVTDGNRLVSSGTPTSPTRVTASNLVPPSAQSLRLHVQTGIIAANVHYLRYPGLGSSSSSTLFASANTSFPVQIILDCNCDGDAAFEYWQTGTNTTLIDLIGYTDKM